MAVTLDTVLLPVRTRRERETRRRHFLMLGASAALHIAVLAPMILLAAGDDPRFQLPPELPIIQVQLEEPIRPPAPVQITRPRIEPQPIQPAPLPQPQPPEQTPMEQVPESPLTTPQPIQTPSPLERSLPQLQPPPRPAEAQNLDALQGSAAPSPLSQALPSVVAPRPEVQSIDRPSTLAPPSAISAAPPRVNAPAQATAPQENAAEASPTNANDLPLRRRDEEERERAAAAAAAAASGSPSPPMPRLASPAPGVMAPPAGASSPVPGVSEAWRVAPSSQAGRNARALRTSPLGCRSRERLTPSEQALCDERFNADAAAGAQTRITGSGNAARDARFAREGAREMYNYEARRRPLSGGTGNVGTADCPGSNLGTGCAGSLLDPSLQMDSTTNIRTNKTDGPRPTGPQVPGSAGVASRPGNGSD
ncbi:hypothetical protein [Brevundimonas vesicularis]|uniref:hypothetical protein n=1 Tax=Brevundimonas vesicularis TaxID=41276 RepID=UPI0038D39082